MPTYDYRCTACGHEFELFQSMKDSPKRKCPSCNKAALERLIGIGAAVVFKGSGFYQTDYRSEAYKKAADADKAPAASETKPAEGKSPEAKDAEGKSAEAKCGENMSDPKNAGGPRADGNLADAKKSGSKESDSKASKPASPTPDSAGAGSRRDASGQRASEPSPRRMPSTVRDPSAKAVSISKKSVKKSVKKR